MDTAARDVAMLQLRAATRINEDINSGVVRPGPIRPTW
jgi:hypothetical protein